MWLRHIPNGMWLRHIPNGMWLRHIPNGMWLRPVPYGTGLRVSNKFRTINWKEIDRKLSLLMTSNEINRLFELA